MISCHHPDTPRKPLSIAKKSLDSKVRADEERINLGKRNLESQAAAQVEQSTLVAQLQSQIEEAIQELSGLVPEDISASDLKTVVAEIETSLIDRKPSTERQIVQLVRKSAQDKHESRQGSEKSRTPSFGSKAMEKLRSASPQSDSSDGSG
jgi:hypothetical protein